MPWTWRRSGSGGGARARVVRFGCPYCRRVKDTLEAKGIAYEKIENDSDEVGAKIMEISNQSLVPVIVDGDKVINDSQKIIDYLNENYWVSLRLKDGGRHGFICRDNKRDSRCIYGDG
jgi:glutathione S-transferase